MSWFFHILLDHFVDQRSFRWILFRPEAGSHRFKHMILLIYRARHSTVETLILEADESRLVQCHIFRTAYHFFPFLGAAIDEPVPESHISHQSEGLRELQTFHLMGSPLFIQGTSGAIFHTDIALNAKILSTRRVRRQFQITENGRKQHP
jgi:hypothetical protein